MVSLAQIFSWFETGDFPTQQQFQDTFSSFWHKGEKISATAIEGFPALTPDGIKAIKIWIGMATDLPPAPERLGTKTLYIALTNPEEIS